MTNSEFCNNNFSTTKMLYAEEPLIETNQEARFESLLSLPENSVRYAEGGLRSRGYFKKGTRKNPLLSIVTIVYNGQAHIEETILSVINQSYDNVEYIIIDGGSTDNTVDILKKYNDYIDYWVSEKDQGISDAFNKGIRCCTGDLIGLINADDYYEDNAFEYINDAFSRCSIEAPHVIYGKTNKITTDGCKQIKSDYKSSWCVSAPFSHCSSFVTMSYYKEFGLFNTSFKIGMDVDLLMRGLQKAEYIQSEYFIATQRDGGVSDRLRLDGYKEYRKIASNHFGYIKSTLGYLLKVVVFYKKKVLK